MAEPTAEQNSPHVTPAKAGAHNHRVVLWRDDVALAFAKLNPVAMGAGSTLRYASLVRDDSYCEAATT
ncbi:hypothetical protein GCM10007857_41710 [Bradyrhizobium iriomotense]|uniref:Uncharacterized protein n=1 Tax=Bradyrhizobium iriomotense TaxID=441950 RepID=A0ABQ6B3J0_9BRAD|nr:hypothetical protein GCM10007857_41710 [Bradyrhizobium iriomotense]